MDSCDTAGMSLPEFPADQVGYPESSQATMAVVLGILGIFFTIFAPFAWWVAHRELEAIDAGRRSPENRGTAKAGKVLGIIGTVLMALSILLLVVLFVVFADFLVTG